MNTKDFLQTIQGKAICIFGTGYVARVFFRALQEHGLTGQVRAFVVSDIPKRSGDEKNGKERTFCGRPVLSAAAYKAETDRTGKEGGNSRKKNTAVPQDVLCLAVHESILDEVRETLAQQELTGIWIYPFLFDMLYGGPADPCVRIPVSGILKNQPSGQYWLAVRYGALREDCEGNAAGTEVYKKSMSLFSAPATAQKRLDHFMRLAGEIRENGFDPERPVLLDENYRIIDGLHRIVLAAYRGIEALPCRIYAASSVYDEVLDSRNFLTEEILQRPEFSEEERNWIRTMDAELKKKCCPVISMILPVYNVAAYMDVCMQSITEQTFRDFEVLLIDDGSTDGSGAACDRWAEKDARIRVIHQENGGVSSARNRGIDEACGEWLAFADPDDWLDVTYLEKLYRAAREKEADFAECDIWRYNNKNGEKIHRSCGGTMGIPWTREEHMIYGSTASYKAISRRSLWTENGIRFPDCAFESPAVYALVLALAERVVNIPEPLYYYRRFRPLSLIETGYAGKNGEANNTLGTEAMEHLLSEFRRLGLYEQYEQTLQRVVTYRLSDILATQFYRKSPEDYRATADNFRAFLQKQFPEKEDGTGSRKMQTAGPKMQAACRYMIFGGYNLNRILLHCGMLQDPYGRFNFSSLISIAEANPADTGDPAFRTGAAGEAACSASGTGAAGEGTGADRTEAGRRKPGSTQIRHKNRYREMMLQREEGGAFWSILEEIQPSYLFMDLIEERFDIIERDGRYVTASDARDGAWTEDGEGTDVQPSGGRTIPRSGSECRQLFREKSRVFFERIRNSAPGTRIVIVENYLCTDVGTYGRQKAYDNAKEIRQMNAVLQEEYAMLGEACPEALRITPRELPGLDGWLFTDEKYEYGAIPSHLNEIANRKIAGCMQMLPGGSGEEEKPERPNP